MSPMHNTLLKLHPSNYLNIPKPLIFYLSKGFSSQDWEKILKALAAVKTLVVTSFIAKDKSRRYNLHVGEFCLTMQEGYSKDGIEKYINFILWPNKHPEKAKRSLYHGGRQFTIIPEGGIQLVYNNELHDTAANTINGDWHMDEDLYDRLVDHMERYFDSEEDEDSAIRVKVTGRFEHNVLKPFRDYTDKENWAEECRQRDGDSISYFHRRACSLTEKGPVYEFFSMDHKADPKESFFAVGDRVSVVAPGKSESYKGILNSIDDETEEAVVYNISFFRQFNDADLPESGELTKAVNDTQTRVRSKVIRKIERGQVEATYMYRTFHDFSTDEYEAPADDLAGYLAQKMNDKYPPNQMQLEAIIKGILTKDLLLVLGPPGTGKTTVISQWVEYFIKQGKRVLISSQNNAAVDNVLARFKGKGEIVRLGNEDKVQENCKEFLPHYKLGTMSREFQKNKDRLDAALDQDRAAIAAYQERLEKYAALLEEYRSLTKQCNDLTKGMARRLEKAKTAYKRVEETLKTVESTIESRAHKQLFLEEAKKKNVLHRFFLRHYMRQVNDQLKQTEENLERQRKVYLQNVDVYNQAVSAVKAELEKIRSTGLISRMKAAEVAAERYTMEQVFTPEFILKLESELAQHYRAPHYNIIPLHNLPIIQDELQQLQQLRLTMGKLEAAMQAWYGAVNAGRNDIFQNVLLSTCQIVGATCIGINSNRDFAEVKFDVSIVDESGQIQVHNAMVPMCRAPKNLLLGDYMQIPPIADSLVKEACQRDEVNTELLEKSFFQYLFEKIRRRLKERDGITNEELLQPVLTDYAPKSYMKLPIKQVEDMISAVTQDKKKLVNLNSQFRMPGEISDVISQWFYENNYFSSYDMSRFCPMIRGTSKPMVVISTADYPRRQESQPDSKMGYLNTYEAELVAALVERTIQSQPEEERQAFRDHIEDKIGIISAYGAQVRTIREKLSRRNLGITGQQVRSMVASLDSFQGQERPLIIYSLTRSTWNKSPDKGRIGFMKELRRLNVAFTRCQQQLVILGDIDYLCRCMHTEEPKDEEKNLIPWPCEGDNQTEWETPIGQTQIDQCADCPADCERKFARFMRLLMQHVRSGAGEEFPSAVFLTSEKEEG